MTAWAHIIEVLRQKNLLAENGAHSGHLPGVIPGEAEVDTVAANIASASTRLGLKEPGEVTRRVVPALADEALQHGLDQQVCLLTIAAHFLQKKWK